MKLDQDFMKVIFPPDKSASAINNLMNSVSGMVAFLADSRFEMDFGSTTLERMADAIQRSGAGMVYSDAHDGSRIDYQVGSIRDDFDFGPLVAFSVPAAQSALSKYGEIEKHLRWAGLYDLRLKVSIDNPIVHVPEVLYGFKDIDMRDSGDRHFDYVDPLMREYQQEMEHVATSHLKRIGAYLKSSLHRVSEVSEQFPVKASVVIPVRNRESTIREAISSALEQMVDFSYNVIVVDNYSTDGTSRVIEDFKDNHIVHLVPSLKDLAIGGCWNEAIYSTHCGRYAVQLDSDDMFMDSSVLASMVDYMERERYAMLVGSYKTVDFDLNEISPGVVDHKEWTPENGHNNALRINGFGAPRAYDVTVLRKFGFPNVSYGEDYAVGLRMCREYEIGRIYEPLYLCRRWIGNSDRTLSRETLNRFNEYKDEVRTSEIEARIALNRTENHLFCQGS